MADKAENFSKELHKALLYKDEIQEILESEIADDITLEYERIVTIIGRLEENLKKVTDELLDEEKPLVEVREYN